MVLLVNILLFAGETLERNDGARARRGAYIFTSGWNILFASSSFGSFLATPASLAPFLLISFPNYGGISSRVQSVIFNLTTATGS